MARDKVWAAEFQRRLREYDESHGIAHPAVEPVGGSDLDPLPGDSYGAVQQARLEWERSPAIRSEFELFERFVAFKKADAKGLVKIFRGRGA